MRYFSLIVLAVAVLLPGCGMFSSGEPAVADSTMAPLLIELHLHRARAGFRSDDVPRSAVDAARDSILQRYRVTQPELERTLDYYARNPDEYEEVYASVIDSLNVLRTTLSRVQLDSTASAESPSTVDTSAVRLNPDAIDRLRDEVETRRLRKEP
jgi:hypothetical protein